MANLEELGCVIYETLMKNSLETDKDSFLQIFTKQESTGHVDIEFREKLVKFQADFIAGQLSKVSLYATSPFSLVDTALITQNLRNQVSFA